MQRYLPQQSIPLVLGISGGCDSVALFHWLRLANYKIIAVHVNYGLRAIDAEQDELFVRKLSELHGVAFYSKRISISEVSGESKQAIARKMRYKFFYEVLQLENAQAILTAHHADDDAETLLLQWGRGAGLAGIAGIPVVNNLIFRPLLEFTKQDLKQWLLDAGLDWREDNTNQTLLYRRNQVRNLVFPHLKSVLPGFPNTQTMKLLKSQYSLLQSLCNNVLLNAEMIWPNGIKQLRIVSLGEINGIESLIFQWLTRQFQTKNLKPILDFCFNIPLKTTGNQFYVNEYLVTNDNHLIWVIPHSIFQFECNVEMDLGKEITIFLPLGQLNLQLKKNENEILCNEFGFVLGLDQKRLIIQLAEFKKGDKIWLGEAGGTQLISDLLTNSKCLMPKRKLVTVLKVDSVPAVVIGYRTSPLFYQSASNPYVLIGQFTPF